MINILVSLERGETRKIYFPKEALTELNSLGNVKFNDTDHRFSESDMAEAIKDVDICITHWGCPVFTKEVTGNANRLKLIAHAAGSVAYMITDYVYDKGIKVCSSNSIMAKYVAEATLAYILTGLRRIPFYDSNMKRNGLWESNMLDIDSLFQKRVGMIGLGTVGKYFLDMLRPFNANIKIYDPFISQSSLANHPEAKLCSMEEVLSWADIISVHSSLTPDTFHMLNKDKLKLIKNRALLVNTARGAIIDESALIDELSTGRFNAVLDVYEKEPLPVNSPLRGLENVILIPHMAGMAGGPEREQMTFAMIEEIKRFINNKPLQYEISYEKYKRMTR